MPDELLRTREVMRMTRLSRTSIWRLERAGRFPRRRALVGPTVAWLRSEVEEWMHSRPTVDLAPVDEDEAA